MDKEHSQDLISAYSKNQLIGASAWARILGIIGFVFAGLLVCLALFVMSGGMGSIMGANMPEGGHDADAWQIRHGRRPFILIDRGHLFFDELVDL